MTTITELLAQKANQKPALITAAYLARQWQKHLSDTTGTYARELIGKERGQLQHFIADLGPDRALTAMLYALQHWEAFTHAVKVAKGIALVPNTPIIGFMLMHDDVLVSMISLPDQSSLTYL